ncbi:DUF4062 domain-containing protein [Methylobacter sp.]|uniref:DUF4062 domain-containing protein n=1 Tax=Methylobacter sp. TaxID=2051955 RepID=UPI003DA66174
MNKIGQPKQNVPIFVSSTYEDLIEYRSAAKETLHRLETIVRGMEYFGSKPGSPKEECLKAVRSCHVYIGIFAMRYGSVDEESGKSMTHLEYEEATKLGLPSLIYLIDEQTQPVLPKFVETGDKAESLKALKEELMKKYMVSFFTTPEDLAKKITQDLPPILQGIGVIVADEEVTTIAIEDTKNILNLFHARPRKHSGKEIIIEAEIQNGLSGLGQNECEAFGLTIGDAIKRKVNSDVLGKSKELIAVSDVADWLENVPTSTKARLKIRLIFGTAENQEWGPEGPFITTTMYKGYRVVAILKNEPDVEAEKMA